MMMSSMIPCTFRQMSSRMTLTTLLALFAVSVQFCDGAKQCDVNSLVSCEAYSALNVDIRNSKTTYDTEQKLNAVCSKLPRLVQCRDNNSCAGYDNGKLDRYIDTMTYVCGEAKAIYVQKVGCFVSDQTRGGLSDCTKFRTTTNGLNNTCRSFSSWLDCNRKIYEVNCGKQPADVIVTVLEKIDPCSAAGQAGYKLMHNISLLLVAIYITYWSTTTFS